VFRGWAGQRERGEGKRELDGGRRVRIQLMLFDSGRDNMPSSVYCVQKYSRPPENTPKSMDPGKVEPVLDVWSFSSPVLLDGWI
jgi:hypothetical protein